MHKSAEFTRCLAEYQRLRCSPNAHFGDALGLPLPLFSQLILLAYASFQSLCLTITSHCSRSGGQCIADLGKWANASGNVRTYLCTPNTAYPNSDCPTLGAAGWCLNSVQMGGSCSPMRLSLLSRMGSPSRLSLALEEEVAA